MFSVVFPIVRQSCGESAGKQLNQVIVDTFFLSWIFQMTDKKAVIKNADMTEEDAKTMPSIMLSKHWKSSASKKTLLLTSRKSLTRNTTQHGIALSGGTLVRMSRTRTKHFIYFYLGQVAILLFKSG